MNYTQLLEKALNFIKKHPAILVVSALLALAPWMNTSLQGTIDWTGKGISVHWTTLPALSSLIVIGTLTILWLVYRLVRKLQAQSQKS